jgi:hypothetical protein
VRQGINAAHWLMSNSQSEARNHRDTNSSIKQTKQEYKDFSLYSCSFYVGLGCLRHRAGGGSMKRALAFSPSEQKITKKSHKFVKNFFTFIKYQQICDIIILIIASVANFLLSPPLAHPYLSERNCFL